MEEKWIHMVLISVVILLVVSYILRLSVGISLKVKIARRHGPRLCSGALLPALYGRKMAKAIITGTTSWDRVRITCEIDAAHC